MNSNTYAPNVQLLLSLGKIDWRAEWRNYLELGLTDADVPDLIRLATSHPDFQENDPVSWGPIHAWRSLGQLHAAAAIEPLLGEFDEFDESDDDWGMEEVPSVLAMIGPSAADPVGRYIVDPAHHTHARASVANALVKIAQRFPAHRDLCVEYLRLALEAAEFNEPALNGFFVAHLLDLKAMEATATMEKAYANGLVDEWICGDWDDVQQNLRGLPLQPEPDILDNRVRPASPFLPEPKIPLPPTPQPTRRIDHDRLRAQHKCQRQARKKSRRR